MKNILKTTTLALVCSMALTGCIKETFPTDSATSGPAGDRLQRLGEPHPEVTGNSRKFIS